MAGFVGGRSVGFGLFAASAGERFHGAGFVNNPREFVDDAAAGEFLRVFDVNKGDAGAFEELFHVFGVGARGFVGFGFGGFGGVFEFDGADGTEGAFVTEDEIDGFVFDETISGAAVLEADFVAEEGGKVDAGDDIEALTEEVVQELKTGFFGADHEVFAGAIAAAVHGVAGAATDADAGENRHQKERQRREGGDGDEDLIGAEIFFDKGFHGYQFWLWLMVYNYC